MLNLFTVDCGWGQYRKLNTFFKVRLGWSTFAQYTVISYFTCSLCFSFPVCQLALEPPRWPSTSCFELHHLGWPTIHHIRKKVKSCSQAHSRVSFLIDFSLIFLSGSTNHQTSCSFSSACHFRLRVRVLFVKCWFMSRQIRVESSWCAGDADGWSDDKRSWKTEEETPRGLLTPIHLNETTSEGHKLFRYVKTYGLAEKGTLSSKFVPLPHQGRLTESS